MPRPKTRKPPEERPRPRKRKTPVKKAPDSEQVTKKPPAKTPDYEMPPSGREKIKWPTYS